MKKGICTLIMIVCSFSLNAQKSKIIGTWLITKIETPDKTERPYMVVDFTKRGKILIKGTEFATWSYNKKKNLIKLKSNVKKDFNGTNEILNFTDKELILEKEDVKTTYLKLNFDNIAKENATSNLIGEWKIENEFDNVQLLKIELPDTFTLIEISSKGKMTSKSKGTWVYNSMEKSVLFMGMSKLLKGNSIIKELSENKFIFEKEGVLIAAKKENSSTEIARLTFNVTDFPNRQSDVSPWTGFDALLKGLENITYLKYRERKLISNTNSFYDNLLLSKIDLNIKGKSISLANLIITKKDSTQYSESYKGGLLNRTNDFFPQKELGPFRVLKTEIIKVPAGEFKCKVVEGFDGEAKLKYWMVIDKPGVYAKIIREDLNVFNKLEYSVTELEELK
ncbi:hypothetical protein [Polaribacter sp. L3A8]|uniref:hypothetical protein n=1 Tax=Polaribacter sp. L3A8 TaxID=2686361 RepID=UPI00131ADEDB|nr:hypothetical protein [Polaribacter sp. L3A8]